MQTADWLEVIRSEYLDSFVAGAGASVKFIVPTTAEVTSESVAALCEDAAQRGYVCVRLDAATTKLHLADRLFGAVAQAVDWDVLANAFVWQRIVERGLRSPMPAQEPIDLRAIAAANDADEALLRADLRRAVENEIMRDYAMTREFRLAMRALCQAQLDRHEDPALHQFTLEWLRGELRLVSSIKRALIFQRVARHTALGMLASLAHWLRRVGRRGLVLVLDISRYSIARRRVGDDSAPVFSLSATLDLYELLRQLIDATDELEGCFVAVVADPQFLSDDRRGLRSYQALYFRVGDDVRDRFRENPLAPLVRIGGAA